MHGKPTSSQQVAPIVARLTEPLEFQGRAVQPDTGHVNQFRLGGGADAQLTIVEDQGENFVYDSRTGEEQYYPLTKGGERLLKYLETPRSEKLVMAQFDPGLLVFAKKHGLVFEERGRYMSLVVT